MKAIKQKNTYIYALCMAAGLLMSAACSEYDEPAPTTPAPEGYTYLDINLPNAYGHLPVGGGTQRAVSGDINPGELDPNTDLSLLPEGTTVWVLIQKYDQTTQAAIDQEEPYAFRVRAAATGSRNLERIETVMDNRGDSIVYTAQAGAASPLIVEKGFGYRLRMIAPAHELVYTAGAYKIWMDNGRSLMSNDERYNTQGGLNTAPVNIVIDEYASDRTDVELNPLVQQMARLHLSIHPRPDWGVHTTDLLAMGCVIGGLEAGPKEWGPDLGKHFVPQIGPKRGNVVIRNYQLVDRSVADPSQEGKTLVYQSLEITVDVIPMDGTGNSLSIELNARVNGVPVQLMTLVENAILLHGREYTANFNLSIDNGITILNFTTMGWGTEVYPDNP